MAVNLASDDFDPLDPTSEYGWLTNNWGVSDTDYVTSPKSGGDCWLKITGDASTATTASATRRVDLSNVTGATLAMSYKLDMTTTGAACSLQASDDGSTWTTLLSTDNSDFTNPTTGDSTSVSLGSFDGESDVYIRFVGEDILSVDTFEITGVTISGTGSIADTIGLGGDGTYIAQDNFTLLGDDEEYGWLEDDWAKTGSNPNKLIFDNTVGSPKPSIIFSERVDFTYAERGLDLSDYSAVKIIVELGTNGSGHSSTDCFQIKAQDLTDDSWDLQVNWIMHRQSYILFKEKSIILDGDYLGADSRLRFGVGYQREAWSWIDTIRIQAWETAAPTGLDLDSTDDSGSSSTDNITNVNTGLDFSLTGLVDGADFTVYVDDVESTASVTVDAQDSSLGTFSLDLTEGVHVISVTQEDTGQSMGVSDPIELTVTVDTTGPGTCWLNGDDFVTNDSTPTMMGYPGNGSPDHVKLYESTTHLATADVVGDNFYIYDAEWLPGVSLTEGVHQLFIKSVDVAGNESAASGTVQVTVDLTAPTVSTVTINDGEAQRHSIDEIAYTFSETVIMAMNDLSVYWYDSSQSSWVSVNISSATRTGYVWNLSGVLSNNGHYVAVLSDDVTDSAGNALAADHVTAFYQVAGDFDGDGEQEGADIDMLFSNIGGSDMLYDLDDDSDVDSVDADELIHNLLGDQYPGTEYGDFNLDGLVDQSDSSILSVNFGTGTTWAEGDCDGDADVDMDDFIIMKSNLGVNNTSFDLVDLDTAPTYP